MTTLAEMTLQVTRLITDVIEGTATLGGASYLVDTKHLIQGNQYFDRGTLWILSGDQAGKVLEVTSFSSNALTFATLPDDGTISVGDRFAVARASYPYPQLRAAINDALRETFIVEEAQEVPPITITGDGQSLIFPLPTGHARVVAVELEDPEDADRLFPSSHWRERNGSLIFAGSPPLNEWKIHIYTRQDHPELVLEEDELNEQIGLEWLRWKAAEHALYWGMGVYQDAKEYRIEERLNRVIEKGKTLRPRLPLVIVRTAGG